MFIGHWAAAFAAGAISPKAPKLGTLFVAAQLVDWGFFTLAIVGVEEMRITPGITAMNPMDLVYMPYTHSLLGTFAWAAAFAIVVLIAQRNLVGGILAGLVVLSHWLADWLVHRPDLTIAGGDTLHGLGLWNYPFVAIPLELALTLAAFVWYMRRTRGPIIPPLILMALLLLMQASNWFGPQPQSAGLGFYLLALFSFAIATFFAFWVGTTRRHERDRG